MHCYGIKIQQKAKENRTSLNQCMFSSDLFDAWTRSYNSTTVLGCVHTMPAHFENGEKCDGCKI